MPVYFLRPVGMAGPIKIGCSRLPEGRLAAFMLWSPVPLEIAARVEGDWRLERRLHGIFDASHSHSEWFTATPQLTELIARLAAGEPIGDIIDLDAPLMPFSGRPHGRRKKGNPVAPPVVDALVELAKVEGIARDSYTKWKGRRAVPHCHRATLLAAAQSRGIAITPADFEWGTAA